MLFRSSVPADDRRLIVRIPGQPLEVLFARTDDIPTLIADGAADVGVAGGNQLLEHGDDGIAVLAELGYGPCTLVVAAPFGYRCFVAAPTSFQRWLSMITVRNGVFCSRAV